MKIGDLVIAKQGTVNIYDVGLIKSIGADDYCGYVFYEVNGKFYYQHELTLVDKSKVIKFKDYNGYLNTNNYNNLSVDTDDYYDYVYGLLEYEEKVNPYIFGTKKVKCYNFDLKDAMERECENDGYEDMEERLDFNHEFLKEAKQLIEKWEKNQGEYLYCYEEDKTVVIDLTDVINKIKKEWLTINTGSEPRKV